MQIKEERKTPSGDLGQCSRTSRGSVEQTLGVLPMLMFTARKSDVNTSSQGFYSELSLCCQEVLLGTGLKFPPSVAMYCLMPKTVMEMDRQFRTVRNMMRNALPTGRGDAAYCRRLIVRC